jgi:hypothetical protein
MPRYKQHAQSIQLHVPRLSFIDSVTCVSLGRSRNESVAQQHRELFELFFFAETLREFRAMNGRVMQICP